MSGAWLVLLVVCGLATFRLTRLITKDDFPLVAKPREWVIGGTHWEENGWASEGGTWQPDNKHEGKWYYWFGELISCPWCASGWVSLGLTLAVAWWTPRDAPLVDWALLWWSSWAIGSWLAAKVD